jgi:hypothetical protein
MKFVLFERAFRMKNKFPLQLLVTVKIGLQLFIISAEERFVVWPKPRLIVNCCSQLRNDDAQCVLKFK